MEVDIDSLITTTSSDDDDLDSTPYLRTVDEILNEESDSSSSPSPTRPSSSPSIPNQVSRIPEREPLHQSPALERPDFGSLEEEPPGPSHRRPARQLSSSASLPSGGLRGNLGSRSLPPLFGGIRSSSKPGAALAAAAAASRSIPTPHAAKIKWRKSNSIEGLDSNVSVEENEDLNSKVIMFPGLVDDEEAENLNLSSSSSVFSDAKSVASDVVISNAGILLGDGGNAELSVSNDESGIHNEMEASNIDTGETTISLPDNSCFTCTSETGNKDLADNFTSSVEETDHFSLQQSTSQDSSSSTVDDSVHQLISDESSNIMKSEKDNNYIDTCDDGESIVFTERKTMNDTGHSADMLCERMGQIESSKNVSRKKDKKLLTSMKPLEWAEELEKRKASSGLHWEEGAAAQPMRLEGIKREAPAVGYLQIDSDNAITRAISSHGFYRDHGSSQVLATHAGYIAIGTSKGIVYVVSSKYSAHSSDNIDSKMTVLTSQSDKANVTSMCFNQQGDLLLVGYGDGHVIIWDTQKGVAVKVIAGEHLAPVVHALFLGQDSQVGRQFKAVTGDIKGLLLLHTFSVVPLLNRFSVKTQCLLDGKKTGIVLSVSPLLMDDSHLGAIGSVQGSLVVPPSGLSSMVGGVVGGVVGGETGWKFFNEGTATVEEGVVVFVTHQNALVVRLTPSLEVYANLPKPDGIREGSIPYTAWKFAHFHRGSSRDASEVISWLVIAWDQKIQVLKLVKSELKKHKEWSVDSGAIGVAWLDDQMLVVLTSRKQLCLFSRDGDEIYRTNYVLGSSDGDDNISYHTYFNNSLGNPEKAYHNSVAVRGATIYILGPSHLTVSRLLPWKERIQVLLKAGDWMGALDMSMRLYDGHAHGVVDLPRTVEMIREVIMPYLVELILSYVDEVFSYISVSFSNQHENVSQANGQSARSESAVVELEEQFARVGGVAVEFCIHIRRTDILFDGIFSRFMAVQHGGTFLEILEPYILKDMLGCIPPEIMQALVEHYSTKGWLERVEQCVLHMDISSLDFNQIVRLCREHALYGALIYLFNQGLDDYKTPLEELLLVAQNLQITKATALGYRMLVYLKHCFLGLAFPPGHGKVSLSRLPSLKEELLQFLLQNSNALTPEVVKSFKSSHGALPNLCFLLWFDTEATLDVLRHAFSKNTQEKSAHGPESVAGDNLLEERENSSENTDQDMLQKTVDCLIFCFNIESSACLSFEMGEGEVGWPSKKDFNHVIDFIAFYVASKQVIVSEWVLKHILQYLTLSETLLGGLDQKTVAYQRERQVILLLQVAPRKNWDSSYVLDLCRQAQYQQACGLIHSINGQFIAALDSYIKDMDRPTSAFAFIHVMLLQLEGDDYTSFRSAVISRFPDLVRLSREGAFFLVIDHFSEESQQILSELQANPRSLFLFLKSVIDVHLQGTLNFASLEKCGMLEPSCRNKNGNKLNDLEAYLDRLSSFPNLLHRNPIQVTDEIAELYLELLCQYEHSSVLKFLETFENYNLERSLRLCQDYGITDAAAFLLERAGDVGGAFSLATAGLEEKFDMLSSAVRSEISKMLKESTIDMERVDTLLAINEVRAVYDILQMSISLCQRNSGRIDLQESESLWFNLLDMFCEPLRRLCCSEDSLQGRAYANGPYEGFSIENKAGVSKCASIFRKLYSQLIRQIIEGMIGYVPVPKVMNKLLSDNGNQEFGDFKQIIMGMLGTYGFERRILDTAKSLIEDDTFYTMCMLKKGASHAYALQTSACCICNCLLMKEASASSIRIYHCGHATHIHCESQDNGQTERAASAGCPICMPQKKSTRPKGKGVLMDNHLIGNSASGGQSMWGGGSIQHLHEPEQVERSYGSQQMPRFEILNNLQKASRLIQIDSLPQLKLAPPAVYHEKVQKGSISSFLEENSGPTVAKRERHSRNSQQRKPTSSGLSKRFHLRSNILG